MKSSRKFCRPLRNDVLKLAFVDSDRQDSATAKERLNVRDVRQRSQQPKSEYSPSKPFNGKEPNGCAPRSEPIFADAVSLRIKPNCLAAARRSIRKRKFRSWPSVLNSP